MTRDDLQAVYAAGPDAVLALFEQLQARIEALEDRLATNSRNSNHPPSSDGPATLPKPRSLRQKTGKKPGGQPGHPGHSLRMSATPDRIVVHRPAHCHACGQALAGVAPRRTDRCQVIDLPVVQLEVVEHQAETVCCPICQHASTEHVPAEARQAVQYGPRILALGVYLHVGHLVPSARSSGVFTDLFGAGPSEGTLLHAVQTCATVLQPVEAAIKQGIQHAEVGHFDESGLRVAGRRQWLHVASTPLLTHYGWHPKRGRAATDSIGILPAFGGTALHDGWRAYWHYPCQHALCNVHHLRELTFLHEQQQHAWAGEMKTLLVAIKQQVDQVQALGATCLDPARSTMFEHRYHHLLAVAEAAHPPPDPTSRSGRRGRLKQSKARNLLDRLRMHQQAVLAFMYDFRVPFDNNLAERDIRMVKVHQKVAGCFRSTAGASAFCRIRGYISTLRKQGYDVLNALECAMRGQPLMPALPR